jgi:Flp pilus assembly protein TadD
MDAVAYLSDRAVSLVEHGQVGAAIDAFHQALTIQPDQVDIRLNLSVLLNRMGWHERAGIEAGIACRMAPHEPRAHLVRGVAAIGVHDYTQARRSFEEVLSIDPTHIDGLLNLASVLSDGAEYDAADRLYRRVLKLERERPEALSGLATIAVRQMDFETAMPLYDRACAHPTNPAIARWNRALALLSVGRMAEAWPGFEARLEIGGGSSVQGRRFAKPIMSVLPEKSCRIHVHDEQGFGDVLQFSRYVPMLRDLGHTVTFEVRGELVRLLAGSFSGINVISQAIDYPGTCGVPEFDEQVPLESLPGLFGTTEETIPWDGPYLKADADEVMIWRDRLGELRRPLIGVCWAGSSRADAWCKELDRRRSIELQDIILAIGNRSLISLQLGPACSQMRDWGIWDLSFVLHDWADTAALVANLDVVISVDTAVAHLAGAMGKRVLMLDRWDHCWRWPQDGVKTPWYPTMTILRQESMGDWSAPLEKLGEVLRNG